MSEYRPDHHREDVRRRAARSIEELMARIDHQMARQRERAATRPTTNRFTLRPQM